ncbi:hypothetical protein BDZ91DRAFT_16599 [Kalaharituber pfeilii]|nr:hypothetical protein BDZ91DRAFT_16599 [Kalaharituber pfeilii]
MLKDKKWKNLCAIQKSKGIGEPPLFMASSVSSATRDSLRAARSEHDCDQILNVTD